MKTKTMKIISELLEEVDPYFWGSITLRIQKGEVVNIRKEESIKVDALDTDSGTKFAQ